MVVALYFLLACLVSWLLLFPGGREMLVRTLGNAGVRWQRRIGDLARRREHGTAALRRSSHASLRDGAAFLRRHWLLCLGGLTLICVPPLAALLASGKPSLSGFDMPAREMNTQVAGLLEGEQLVPPAPLPPLAFATAELRQERPLLVSASRDWAMLDAVFAQRLLLAFKIMKERHGYDMALLEGYRSPQRQNVLAAMGPSVTNAAAFQSWHQYGLAADCAFLRDGKLVISEKDPWAMRGYRLYGEVAESLGLTWGGRWKMMDFGHAELRVAGVMRR